VQYQAIRKCLPDNDKYRPHNEDDSQPTSDPDRGGVSELWTNMLSVVKPVVESSQNLSEHLMRLRVPLYYDFMFAVSSYQQVMYHGIPLCSVPVSGSYTVSAETAMKSEMGNLMPEERTRVREFFDGFHRSGWKGIPRCPALAGSGVCNSRFTTTGSWPFLTTTASHVLFGSALISWCGTYGGT
jgi:hypothetical protein